MSCVLLHFILQESKDNHRGCNGSRSHGEDGITSFTCAVLACCRRQQCRVWDHYTARIGLCRIVDFCGHHLLLDYMFFVPAYRVLNDSVCLRLFGSRLPIACILAVQFKPERVLLLRYHV
jgi:hypothetical protein